MSNLYLLPASQSDDKNAINSKEMATLISGLKEEFDVVLVDCPAGIEQGFKNAIAGVQEAIVVTTPEVSAIRDADRVIGLLCSEGIQPVLLINRIDRDMVRKGDMLAPKDVVEILGIEQVGLVMLDSAIIVAANKGESVVFNEKSEAGRSFMRIADRLLGITTKSEDLDVYLSWWARLGRRMRAA